MNKRTHNFIWITLLAICLLNPFMASAEESSETASEVKAKGATDVLILGQFGYNIAPQMSYGAMVGVVGRRSGFYVKYLSDFNSLSTDRECDNLGYDTQTGEMLYFYDESERSRMSATAGYIYRLSRVFNLYAGAGYGYRTLAWHERYDDMVMVKDRSYEGVAADLGVIIKAGPIGISVGASSVDFKYCELNVGFGFIF